MSEIRITDFVEFNPKRTIKKGVVAPFVDMAALPVDSRDISEIGEREFTGSGSKFINGDTLFARITPCLENGKTAKVSGLPEGIAASGSTEFIVMAAKEPEYDEDYVYYLARLPEFRSYAQARMEGTSGRQRVPWQSLVDFEFDFPAKEKRKEIGAFLKKIDDKIELNRQTNQTLEAIAQAIFKSWFVDFEPTRAKIAALEAGEDPERAAMAAISGKSLDELDQLDAATLSQLQATAALFPDALVESELGEVPEGWGVKTIADISTFPSQKVDVCTLSAQNYISTENMIENRGGVTSAASLPDVATVAGFAQGHILISNIRPYFKKIWLARFSGGRSGDVLAFEPKEKDCIEFLYNLLYQDQFFEFMMRTSKGAKMPRGDKAAISNWKLACAPRALRSHYSMLVRSYYSRIHNHNLENTTLSEVRDALLPRLLSGEIDVIKAE